MAKLQHFAPRVTVEAIISLDQDELGALDALAGYGVDAFLTLFYKHMGEAYLKPHEAGLRSFLQAASHASQGVRAAREAQRDLDEYRIEKSRRKAQAATSPVAPNSGN